MTTARDTGPGAGDRSASDPASRFADHHVRGSTLFLGGRFIGIGFDFTVHVILLRYLSLTEFGAFAFALAVADIGSSLAVIGFDKAVGRFVPIYEERRDYPRVFGTVLLMVGMVVLVGLLIAFVVIAAAVFLRGPLSLSEASFNLLLFMIFLAPLQALRSLGTATLAVFSSPRAIFIRRYLVLPSAQLAAVAAVALLDGGLVLIALSFVGVGILGVVLDVLLVGAGMRRQGILHHLHPRRVVIPFRDVLGFSAPLVVSDVGHIIRTSAPVVIIELLRTTAEVAVFRAAVPIARQNGVVQQSFRVLYMPLASRLYARHDREATNDLYWTSAMWIAVFSFPIFLVSFALAEPIMVLVGGERYRESGLILAALALGYYVNAALGFNSLSLRVYGRVRYLVTVDLAATAASLVATVVLVDAFGAVGAAAAVSGTMIVQNALYHLGLGFGTDVRLFEWRYLRLYVAIAASAITLLAVELILDPPLLVGLALAVAVSLGVLLLARDTLNILRMFPELSRLPLARWLFGSRADA